MLADKRYRPSSTARSLSFGGKDHATSASERSALLVERQSPGLSPLPSQCGSPQSVFGSGECLWRGHPLYGRAEYHSKPRASVTVALTPRRRSVGTLPKKKPSWSGNDHKGRGKIRRNLSRRHSISFESPPVRELSKLKGFCTQTSLEGRPGFEFVCSEQFREKYDTYMGLDKEPTATGKLPRFLMRLQSMLFRSNSRSNASQQSARDNIGDGGMQASTPPGKSNTSTPHHSPSPHDAASTGRKQYGVCDLCKAMDGKRVPQRAHVTELIDARKRFNLGQDQVMDSAEKRAKPRRTLTAPSLKSPQSALSPTPPRTWRQWRKSAVYSPRARRSQSQLPRKLDFIFDETYASDGLWISSKGHFALSLGKEQPLVAQPGFKEGRHSWRITVMSSASVPNALKAVNGNAQPKVTPRKGWRKRVNSSGSDYALPLDAIHISPKLGTERIPCFAEEDELISSPSFLLSVGLCLQSYVSQPAFPAHRPTMEETAALRVSVLKESNKAKQSPKSPPAPRHSSTAGPPALSRSVSLLDRFSYRRSSCQTLDEDSGDSSMCSSGSVVPDNVSPKLAEVMQTGMTWKSGDTGTVSVDCTEQHLTVTNHCSGEAYSLPLGDMVSYNNVVDTESSEESGDDDDDFALGNRFPSTVVNGLAPYSDVVPTPCRSQRFVRTKWLHPFFVLHDPAMVLLIMQSS
eukprot:scpid10416/ scgid22411/ 